MVDHPNDTTQDIEDIAEEEGGSGIQPVAQQADEDAEEDLDDDDIVDEDEEEDEEVGEEEDAEA